MSLIRAKNIDFKAVLNCLKKDPVMAGLIDNYEVSDLAESKDKYGDLVEIIIGQQLSGKAALGIFNRLKETLGKEGVGLTPEGISSIPDRKIRECGVSFNKIKYMRNLGKAISDGLFDLESLSELPDEEVVEKLTMVKGIGRWTAEMWLIFSLGRPDIFSIKDYGLSSAIEKLYYVKRTDKERIKDISSKWKPYRSLASLYLWKSLENK